MTSKELATEIQSLTIELLSNLTKATEGNKAAAVRARRNTISMEKLYKEYRKVSIEEVKQ